jgi:hypothetical protein
MYKSRSGRISQFIVATYIIVLLLLSCSKSYPWNSLTTCLDAIIEHDYNRAYKFFSFQDQSTKSSSEFVMEHQLSEDERQILELSKLCLSYTIKDTSVLGDTCRAVVEILLPELLVDRLNFLFYEQYGKDMVDSLKTDDHNMIYISKMEGLILLIKEDRAWRIYANWKELRKKEAEEAEIRLEYIKHKLRVGNVRVREFADTHRTHLIFNIKNLGEKTLEDIEIFVVCLDRNSKPCYSVTAHPVSSSSKPLGPQKSQRITVDLGNAPPDWARVVEVKVVNCKFSKL